MLEILPACGYQDVRWEARVNQRGTSTVAKPHYPAKDHKLDESAHTALLGTEMKDMEHAQMNPVSVRMYMRPEQAVPAD